MEMTRLLTTCVAALVAGAGAFVQQQPRPAAPDALEQAYHSNNVGAAWLEQFEFAKAADAFREALRLAPGLGIARFNLALALHYDGKPEAAEREARTASLQTPHADYLLGLLAKPQGRAAVAQAAFTRVLARDPEDVAAAIMLGQLKLQQGDVAGAVTSLRSALDAESHNATAAYNLSIALSRAGRAEEARRMLERFQRLRESGTATTLGNGYLEQGRYAEAIVSTGAERDLVDREVPRVRFAGEALGAGRTAAAAPADPVGRRFAPAELGPEGRARIASAVAGAVALFDYDNDGDLDLIEGSPAGDRLWRNTQGRFTLASTQPFSRRTATAVTTGIVAGDYNNDSRTDVLVLRYGGPALFRNDGGGRFTDVTRSAGLTSGATELPLTAAFADLDHDGDLDIVIPGFVGLDGRGASRPLVFPEEFPAAPTRVWRNNGDGRFADVTARSAIAAGHATAIVPTDFDLGRDVDLLVASGQGLALFANQRDGSFKQVARAAGLSAAQSVAALAAGDVNRDGRTDFLVARADQPLLALSNGRARFTSSPLARMTAVIAARFFDYDNDGLLDLVAWTPQGARLLRSLGDQWQEVPASVLADATQGLTVPALAGGRAIAVGDLDGDGDEDLVALHRQGVRILRNEGGNRRGALSLRLEARVSNRSAAGSKVEIRAGSLLQRRETSLATPAAAPADLVFGLGGRQGVDAVRVWWPAGIVQAELKPPADRPLIMTELDRKPSSCPYLFTWNGRRFEFVTDFLGGGELGYWVAPGVRNHPDPDEYVRIPDHALRPKDGRYELRVTNELEEVLYLDHLRLVVVTHPDGTEVYPNEGLVSPPFPASVLHVVTNRRPPSAVIDDYGHDVAGATRAIDRRYPDDFALVDIRGYAEPHGLTIRVDRTAEVLLLTGWTDYAFSSDNVAAAQRGLQLSAPALQVRDAAGAWRTAVAEIGIPVGRPQTVVVDLRRSELRGHREFRVATNMRVYWDRIAAADAVDRGALETVRLDPAAADLAWRGFSGELTPDGREPFGYDYARVSMTSPWKTMPGRYTAEGDVRPLLVAVDDRFVVARPGDEIALGFDAAALRPVAAGWTRTFLLYANGFSKEMDVNSASPDHVGPLPFHGMTGYPAAAGRTRSERDDTAARVVTTPVPSTDAILLRARPPYAADAPRPARPPFR
jgi:Flp pilus assembly protein TadD